MQTIACNERKMKNRRIFLRFFSKEDRKSKTFSIPSFRSGVSCRFVEFGGAERRARSRGKAPPPLLSRTRESWPREESTSRVIGIPRPSLWVALILDVIHGILVSDRPGIPIFRHAGRIPDHPPRPCRRKFRGTCARIFRNPSFSIRTKGKFIVHVPLTYPYTRDMCPRRNLTFLRGEKNFKKFLQWNNSNFKTLFYRIIEYRTHPRLSVVSTFL